MTDPAASKAVIGAVVRARNVTKYFGGVRALDHISFELYPGEVVALVGDNGAGKSTLVKILSGMYQVDEGSIWLGDTEIRHFSVGQAREFGIETVYQQLFLCDNLGAAANVMLGQEPVRSRIGPFQIVDSRRMNDEAQRHIAELGITLTNLSTPVRRLSGGQRQAIAIARATVNARHLIQFDEPTAALGVKQTRATLDLIQRVAAKGLAVLMITHNLDDVFAVAHRIIALRHGRITLDAPLSQASRERVVACMTGMAFDQDGRDG